MRIKQTKVFTYAELSDDAKATARDWYREGNAGDTYFAEYITDMLAPDAAKFLGIEIGKPKHRNSGLAVYWSGFSSQGDGASFEGTWAAARVDAVGLKKEFPEDKELHRIAGEFAAIVAQYPDSTASVSTSGRYSHSGTMHADCESGLEYEADAPAIGLEKQFINAADDIEQLLRDFADWIYARLEAEYDYQNSDECVEESINANEYEFTIDGKLA